MSGFRHSSCFICLATGRKISLIMVVEMDNGVKKTVHTSELARKLKKTGTIGHVMLLCAGSVRKRLSTGVEYVSMLVQSRLSFLFMFICENRL